MSQIKELTKKEVYITEMNKCTTSIAQHDVNILVLERLDPKKVIGTTPAVSDDRGQVTATKGVEAQDLLKQYKEARDGSEKRLDVIKHLITNL